MCDLLNSLCKSPAFFRKRCLKVRFSLKIIKLVFRSVISTLSSPVTVTISLPEGVATLRQMVSVLRQISRFPDIKQSLLMSLFFIMTAPAEARLKFVIHNRARKY